MALFRAQILLEEGQRARLELLARDSGRSMSELVRQAMNEYLARIAEEESVHQSLAAVDRLTELRRGLERKHGRLAPSLLDELRQERDTELFR